MSKLLYSYIYIFLKYIAKSPTPELGTKLLFSFHLTLYIWLSVEILDSFISDLVTPIWIVAPIYFISLYTIFFVLYNSEREKKIIQESVYDENNRLLYIISFILPNIILFFIYTELTIKY